MARLEGARGSIRVRHLGLLALVLSVGGCGARSIASSVPVSRSTPRYEHALAFNYMMLCEHPGGRLRCRGLHPLGDQADAWIDYAAGFERVSLAGGTLCTLREGRAVCWGEEPSEPGSGGYDDFDAPVCSPHSFYGLTGLRELAMTDGGGCVITDQGLAVCWGAPLGLDDLDDVRFHTVAEDARGLAVGADSGCAITPSGVRCWGYPFGYPEDQEPPSSGASYAVEVPQPEQVVTGSDFACARSTDQRIFCWGYDSAGTLGMGPDDGDQHVRPRPIPNLRAVDLVASESSVCALAPDGKTYCWGANHSGQLGLGHTRTVNVPTHVPALDGAVDVVLGTDALCARFASGETRCVGEMTTLTQDPNADVMPPQRMPGGPATAMLLTVEEACLRRPEGVTCYGGGGFMTRGHQEAAAGWPLEQLDEATLTHVANSYGVRCRRWSSGRVACDVPGQARSAPPLEVLGTLDFASAGSHACVIGQDRKVSCWMAGRANSVPTEVPGVTDAASLTMNHARACVTTTFGALQCWNLDPSSLSQVPGPTTTLTDARSVAIMGSRTCVLRRSGEVSCWSDRDAVPGVITGVGALVASEREMCALQDGRVHCLTFAPREVTLGEPIPEVTGVIELASTSDYLCARSGSGGVQCWGRNQRSQFGVIPPVVQLTLSELPSETVAPEEPLTFACRELQDEGEDDDYGSEDDDSGEEYEEYYYEDGPI